MTSAQQPDKAASPKVERSPDARAVLDFHRNSDIDARPEAMHHSLGTTRAQASPGDHTHDGVTSIALLEGVTFTGSITSNPDEILKQIAQALTRIGATDNTSA